jgi:hypothetical protein
VSGNFSARGLESSCANYTLEGKHRRIRLLLSSHSDIESGRNWGFEGQGIGVSRIQSEFIRVSVKRDELGFFLNPLCHQSSQW